ncbi:MAG: VCBS repeat-containing protein [Candidatus Melainabacteria bacterium]|nr:VCBS repeat-containing protein [Candidatus Melainabacteria bacterium]
MTSNLAGAFAIPYAIDYIKKQIKITEKQNSYFYVALALVFCVSSLLYWLLGNPIKPLFNLNNGKLSFNGLQTLSYNNESKNYRKLIKSLKSKNISNSSFLSEPEYAEIISATTGLNTPLLKPSSAPLTKVNNDLIQKYTSEYHGEFYPLAYTFDSQILQDQKVKWVYLTQKFVRFIMTPIARIQLLNAYVNKGAKLAYKENIGNENEVAEVYEINPDKLNRAYSIDQNRLNEIANSKDNFYINQIAKCPYFGIYSSMSNDFNGDNISDVAFFDALNKKWYVVYGGNFEEEEEIDLASHILESYEGNDVFIPIPADYDGDKLTDVALFSRNNGLWLIYNSFGKYIVRKNWGAKIGEIPTPANIDGDSKTDIVALSVEKNQSRTPSLLSSTNYSYSDRLIDLSNEGTLVFADIDGDNKDDYILHKASLNSVEILLSSKNTPIKILIGNNFSRIVPADYDGDGKKDIAVWTPDNGTWEIAYAKDLLASNTNEVTTTPEPFIGCGAGSKVDNNEQPPNCGTSIVHFGSIGNIPLPGDYNGDGIDEIATLNLSTYELLILNKDETTTKVDLSKFKGLIPASFIGA